MKKQFVTMFSENWRMCTVSTLLIIIFTICPQYACAGEFKLVKVGGRYEPVAWLDNKGVSVSNGTIKAGPYEYIDNKNSSVGKFGFFQAPSTFLYVDSSNEYSWNETGYGVYNDYLIADGVGYGSAGGHNHLMFLFQITGQSIKLLDVINQAYINVYDLDFWAADGPIIHIKDLDQNGHPEIKLSINWDDSINSWFLYMELIDNRLRVNLNPALYLPLYELEATEKIKTDAYYIYSFLAKKLDRKAILTKLKKNKERNNYIIALLDNVSKWDAAFHHLGDEKFVIKQNNLGGK